MIEGCLTWLCHEDTLVGILHEPEIAAQDLGILFVVGGPQYRVGSHRQFVLMARLLANAGYPVLRFDYRGMGDSGGAARTFEMVDADIRASIDAFCAQMPTLKGVAIFGLCDAASASLMYCTGDSRVTALILANPWVRQEATAARTRIRYYYQNRILRKEFWEQVFSGRVNLAAGIGGLLGSLRSATSSQAQDQTSAAASFLHRMKSGLIGFGRPILLLMSEKDLTGREFDELCRADMHWGGAVAGDRIWRVDLSGADHTFSSRGSLRAACEIIVTWLGQRSYGDPNASVDVGK